MRGIFAAGVLDEFLEKGFDPFQIYIGVSAGACTLASHLANQAGRNHRIFTDYSCRPEFISIRRFFGGGHLLDLDWLWEITIREIRLDLDTIAAHPGIFLITLTDVEAGRALYLEPASDELEDMLRASSALPHLYRGFPTIRGRLVTDGGLADSIPVHEAWSRGATRILVIRSNPTSFIRRDGFGSKLSALLLRKQPRLACLVRSRARRYNETLSFVANPPPGVEIIQLAPPATSPVRRLTKDRELLEEGYQAGRRAGSQAIRSWSDRNPAISGPISRPGDG